MHIKYAKLDNLFIIVSLLLLCKMLHFSIAKFVIMMSKILDQFEPYWNILKISLINLLKFFHLNKNPLKMLKALQFIERYYYSDR